MADLDVALRLRLINGLKAGATEAKRDLAGVGAAAKGLGRSRGLDGLSRDLEGSSARAKRLERQLAGLRNARGFSGLGPALDLAGGGAERVARFTGRISSHLDKAKGSAIDLAGLMERIAGAAGRASHTTQEMRRVQARDGRRVPSAGPGPVVRAVTAEAMIGRAGAGMLRGGLGMVGAGGAVAGAVAAGGKAVKTFADLETAATALAITADKTDAEIAQVVERFRQLGPSLGSSAKEMVEAAQTFVAAGLDFDTAIAAVPPSVKAAKASFGEIADTAKAGVAAINNLEISAEGLPEAFDRMAKAGKEGNVELKNLARILPSVAASGANLGLKGLSGLTDVVAALEILGKVTATPDEAANRVENLFQKATADETVRNFRKVGEAMGKSIDLEKEMEAGAARGETKLAVLLRLTKELTQGNPFRINELFGDMQARQAIEALLRFEGEFNAMRGRINADSKGMIDRDLARATGRLAADFEKLGAAWDRLAGRIGEGLAPSISSAAKEATGLLERLEKGDTILQRMMTRFGPTPDEAAKAQTKIGDRAETLDAWAETNLPFLSGKTWNAWIDSKLGKTGQEAAHKRDEAAHKRDMAPHVQAAEEEAEVRARPDEIRERIRRREEVLARSRERASGEPGIQRDAAERQVGASEAELGRLRAELAKAEAAVQALNETRTREIAAFAELAAKVQSLSRTGSFGLDGVKGDGSGGIARNGFGLGPNGTKPPDTVEVKAEPQDLSGTAKQTMESFNQGLKAGLSQAEAAVTASAARMKATLAFTATPTITPRISAPAGGGDGAAGGSGAVKDGGKGPGKGAGKSAALRRDGGDANFHGPIHVHGVRDVASLERGIRREADRRARDARNDALHDTGNDFA